MATTPTFISTPRVGIASIGTGQTARTPGTTTNVIDVLTAGSAGTRVLELVVKGDDDPADCVAVFWLSNGTTSYPFDELDLGNPAAASTTTTGYRGTVTYSNLVIPTGWSLKASCTVTPTAGSLLVFALGGDL